MLKVYIIGSDRFNGLKRSIYDGMRQNGFGALAVGFSELYNYPLRKGDYETLHQLENRSIEEADVVILVDNDTIGKEPYVGKDTLRELVYCRILQKTIWTSDMLFDAYLKLRSQ